MFQRLIRFVDDKGHTRFGDALERKDFENLKGTSVPILELSPAEGFKPTGENALVSRVFFVPSYPSVVV